MTSRGHAASCVLCVYIYIYIYIYTCVFVRVSAIAAITLWHTCLSGKFLTEHIVFYTATKYKYFVCFVFVLAEWAARVANAGNNLECMQLL